MMEGVGAGFDGGADGDIPGVLLHGAIRFHLGSSTIVELPERLIRCSQAPPQQPLLPVIGDNNAIAPIGLPALPSLDIRVHLDVDLHDHSRFRLGVSSARARGQRIHRTAQAAHCPPRERCTPPITNHLTRSVVTGQYASAVRTTVDDPPHKDGRVETPYAVQRPPSARPARGMFGRYDRARYVRSTGDA